MSDIKFDEIIPFFNGDGDSGKTARIKINGNFDKIKTWLDGFSNIDELFEKVNLGTADAPLYAIRAKFSLYSESGLTAYGKGSTGTGGSGSLDEALLWQILGNTGNEQIAANHLTTALNSYALAAAIPTKLSQLTNDMNFVTATIVNGYATQTWCNDNFAVLNHKHAWADITDHPTELPASDVYSWAKAAAKPAYAFSEIGGKPTTLNGYGITDAAAASHTHTISQITDIGSANVNHATSAYNSELLNGYNSSYFVSERSNNSLDEVAPGFIAHYYSDSIPSGIIGGNQATIIQVIPGGSNYNGQLAVGFGSPYLAWRNKNNTTTWSAWSKISAGYADSAGNANTVAGLVVANGRNNVGNQIVRTDGNGYLQTGYINSSNGDEGNNSNPIRVWGTNGSDSYLRTYLTSALNVGNADTVDGYHASSFVKMFATNTNLTFATYNSDLGTCVATVDGNPSGYSNLVSASWNQTMLNLGDNFARRKQLIFEYGTDNIYYRRHNDDWTTPRILAFIDNNVASATKIQTARSLWGQSFDGTGDVNGTLSIRNGNSNYAEGIRLHASAGNWNTIILCGSDNTGDVGTSANSWSIHNTGVHDFVIAHNDSTGVNGIYIRNSDSFIGLGTTSPAYKLDVNGDIIATSWLRTRGVHGWYNETYGGGWYMEDGDWIRAYNNKSVWTAYGLLGTQGGLTVGYGGANPPSLGAIISGNVGIGTSSPSSKLHVAGDIQSDGRIKIGNITLINDGAGSLYIQKSDGTKANLLVTGGMSCYNNTI